MTEEFTEASTDRRFSANPQGRRLYSHLKRRAASEQDAWPSLPQHSRLLSYLADPVRVGGWT